MTFVPKEKEPKLSKNMQDIINKSMGENVVCADDDIVRFKYRIMNKLVSDSDIISSLHGSNNPSACRNSSIISYLKIPDLQDSVKTYICYDVQLIGNGDMSDVTIIFRIVTYKDEVMTDWGIPRQDLIGAIIKHRFDWSNIFGLHLELAQDAPNIGEDGFYYREIIYTGRTPNSTFTKLNRNLG